MAPLRFQNTTFANKTDHNIYLSFPPALPLEITPGKDIHSFSAQVEEIYLRDSTTQEQTCYSLEKDLSLEADSVISIVGDSDDLYLQYSKADDQATEVVQFVKASNRHQIDLDIGTQPFKTNTLLSHIFETADKQDGPSLSEPIMVVGSRGDEDDDSHVSPSAISHHLLQTFFYEKNEEIIGTRSADDQPYIPATSHFNTMPYNDATNQYFYQQTLEANDELQEVRSMLGLLAAGDLAEAEKRRGRRISPTQETALHNQIVADAYFKAPFSPLLAGLLSVDSQGNKKIDHTCNRNEVHMYFIKQLSLGLGLDETAYGQLDRLLTDTSQQLASGNFDVNDNLNFVLTFTSVPKEKISGSDYESIAPRLTVIYIQSSTRTFSEIVTRGKSSSKVDKVNLKFEYNAMICKLNRRRFKLQQNMFDQACLALAGQSLAEITKRLSPLTIQTSYN
ncbi:hypothetical protein GGI35DRAFT_447802 [Trichoderma velutinum]